VSSSASTRATYHHGDLRNALIAAAAELAQTGGPGSVTIRAAARAAGVTPTAAYRHFAGHEELLHAAKDQAMERMTAAMDVEIARLPQTGDPVRRGLGNLAAVGLGYFRFATAEPGLFRTCFADGLSVASEPVLFSDATPFLKGVAVLDDLVEAGYLPPERRPMAEVTIWASVHGLAMLSVDGPLREAGEEVMQAALERTFEIVAVGLGGRPLTDELREDLLSVLRATHTP
jgi:AcrR family transcriptional regulator